MATPIRLLTFSTLFPNSERPSNGVFVENRLRHLLADGRVESRVMAPVPWFPFRGKRFGDYGAFARVPRAETRHGIPVLHPRYPLIPRVGMTSAPAFMYVAMIGPVRDVLKSGYDFDLIDAHYFYPDGVAAALLGRRFAKPVVITARGTDLNLIPQYALPRRMIQWAAAQADGLITVCQALKDTLVALGAPDAKVSPLRNGVDLETFRPVDRAAARARLGVDGTVALSVGYLIERKGHHVIIEALADLPGVTLLIAGRGPEEQTLRALAERIGVTDRVRFLGQVAHEQLPEIYGAADLLILASSREGWANVLLEAMACGTPVAATNVWGTPEVVAVPEAGRLIQERTSAGVSEAVRALLATLPDRAATRAYAEGFSWEPTTEGQIALFEKVLSRRSSVDPGRLA